MIYFQVTFWISFQINWTCFVFVIGVLHFSCFFIFLNFQRHMHSFFVWNVIKQSESFFYKIWYNDKYSVITQVHLFHWFVKNSFFKYCKFDFENEIEGAPHTWRLSGKSIIKLLKLDSREWDMVALNKGDDPYNPDYRLPRSLVHTFSRLINPLLVIVPFKSILMTYASKHFNQAEIQN